MSISEAQFAAMTKGTQHEHHAKTPEPLPPPKIEHKADDFDYSIYHKAFKLGIWYTLLTNYMTWITVFCIWALLSTMIRGSIDALTSPKTWCWILCICCVGALALLWDFVRNNPVD